MAFQSWVTLANAYQFSGTNKGEVKTSKVLAVLSPGGEKEGPLTIPANYLNAGSIIRFTAAGIYSTKAAVHPTLTLGLYIQKFEAAKALATTLALETESALAEKSWTLQATSRVTAAGEKGKIITAGWVHGIALNVETAKVGVVTSHMPSTKSGTELEFKTTEAAGVWLGATWSEESAENLITCTQWLVEILN